MNKFVRKIRFRQKKTKLWILILSGIVLLPNILLACYGSDIAEVSFLKVIVYLVISIFIFLIPSLFLKMRAFFLFQGIFVLLAPLGIAHIYLNRMQLTAAFRLSVFDTNWNESTELLASLKVSIFFLAATIQKIDSLDAVSALIYVADHGENLFDTSENMSMHGGSIFSEYDLHVPFFVWTSEKYNNQYPVKVENIIQNKDKRLTTDCIFYSFLDMANIMYPWQILEKSIASEHLKEDSVRYIINTNMHV